MNCPFPDTTMTASKKSQKSKSRSKPIIQQGIPANPAFVKSKEFKRSAGSRLVSSTSTSSSARSSMSLLPPTPHKHADESADSQMYSDVEGELLHKVKKKERKGQSHSVTVSASS